MPCNQSTKLSDSQRATVSSSNVTLNIAWDHVNQQFASLVATPLNHGAEREDPSVMKLRIMMIRWTYLKKYSFLILVMKITVIFLKVVIQAQNLIEVKRMCSYDDNNATLIPFLLFLFFSSHLLDKTVTIIEPCPTKVSVLALAVTCAIMVFIYLCTLFCYYTKKWMKNPKLIPWMRK